MTIDNILAVLAFILSAISIYKGFRQVGHQVANQDADTIESLFDSIKKQKQHHDELQKEFEEYKRTSQRQITELAAENVALRRWSKRLCQQLEKAGLMPVELKHE